jgi:hypothetical protein
MEHKFRLSYLRLILDIHSFPLLDGLSMIQESEKKRKKKGMVLDSQEAAALSPNAN